MNSPTADSLRAYLKNATSESHETLDAAMASLDLADPADYAKFLRIQAAARAPVEAWIAGHCPHRLAPPPMSGLIASDLDDLADGAAPARTIPASFQPAAHANAFGVAWALAGSHIGNRAMLAAMRKRGETGFPVSFLSDETMAAFWRGFRPAIEQPGTDAQRRGALAGAEAVFATFAQAASAALPETVA